MSYDTSVMHLIKVYREHDLKPLNDLRRERPKGTHFHDTKLASPSTLTNKMQPSTRRSIQFKMDVLDIIPVMWQLFASNKAKDGYMIMVEANVRDTMKVALGVSSISGIYSIHLYLPGECSARSNTNRRF